MIHVELGPELEETTKADAQARGLTLDQYVQRMLTRTEPFTEKQRSPEELEQFIAAMAEFGKDVPDLTEYAFSRESIYEGDVERILGL